MDDRTTLTLETLFYDYDIPDFTKDMIRNLIIEDGVSVEDAIRRLNIISEEKLKKLMTYIDEEMKKDDIPELPPDSLPKINERDRKILEELYNINNADIDIGMIRGYITDSNFTVEKALQRHLEDVMTPDEIQLLITRVDLLPIPDERVTRVLEDLQPFDVSSFHGEFIGAIRRDVMEKGISLENSVRNHARDLGLTTDQALSFVMRVDEELLKDYHEGRRDYGGELENLPLEELEDFSNSNERKLKIVDDILIELKLEDSPIFDRRMKLILADTLDEYLTRIELRGLIQNLSKGGILRDELVTSFGLSNVDVDKILSEEDWWDYNDEPVTQERSTLLSDIGTRGQEGRTQSVRRRLFTDVENNDTHFVDDDMDIEPDYGNDYVSYYNVDYTDLPQQPLILPEQLIPSQIPFSTCYVLNFPVLNSFMVYDMLNLEEKPWKRFLRNSRSNVIFITFNEHLKTYKGWGIDSRLFYDPMELPQLTTECKASIPGFSLTVLPENVHWDKWYTKFGIENTSGVLASKVLAIPEYVARGVRIFFLSWPKTIQIPASVSGVTMEVKNGIHINLYGEAIDQSSQEHCAAISPTKVYDEILLPDLTTLNEGVPWMAKKRILDFEVLPSICGV